MEKAPANSNLLQKAPSPTFFRRWRRRISFFLLLSALAYLLNVLVLLFFEDRFVFDGARATEDWVDPARNNLVVEDVPLASADGNSIHAWWCPLTNWSPEQGAMLYCHGNSGNLSHRIGWIQKWQQKMGLPVLVFDYPGYGKSSGHPSETGCYASADAAYAWLTNEKTVPASMIVLHGESLGGGVAVDLASRSPHRALVLFRTFPSMPDVGQIYLPWLPVRSLMRNRFENMSKISSCRRPVFISHGTADRLIPFRMGRTLYEAADEPKRFFAEEGKDHGSDHPDELYDAVKQFLEQQIDLEQKSD